MFNIFDVNVQENEKIEVLTNNSYQKLNAYNTLKQQKQKYILHSQSKEKKVQDYIQRIKLITKKNEVISLKYDLKLLYKHKYNDLIQNAIEIQNKAISENLNKCLFITITLNSQFHKYSKKQNNFVFNKNYEKENDISKGYSVLNNTFREIYKQFSKQRKNKINCKYIKVIEQHKDNTPHLHALIFINEENYNETIQIIKNKINCNSESVENNKVKLNYNYEKNINNKIGRVEIENIENIEKGVGYLSKYIKKQFVDFKNIHYLDGWAKMNKIRLISHSFNDISKYIYKKISCFVDKDIKQDYIAKNKNILNYINNNTSVNYYHSNSKKMKKVIEKKGQTFHVNVYKQIKKVYKYDFNNFDYKNDFQRNNYYFYFNKLDIEDKKDFIELKKIFNKDFFNTYKNEIIEDENKEIFEIQNIKTNEKSEYYFYKLLEELKTFIKSKVEKKLSIVEIEIYKNGLLIYSKKDLKVINLFKQEMIENF